MRNHFSTAASGAKRGGATLAHPLMYAVLALVLGTTACSDGLQDTLYLPPFATETTPLDTYETWYAETEVCLGITGDFARVRWFTVATDRWWDPVWEQYAIATWREPHDIYVSRYYESERSVVKHEVIHDLLQGGVPDDPRFVRCSGIGH